MKWNGPSDSYYDPPETHDSNECGCEMCHEIHAQMTDWDTIQFMAEEGCEGCQKIVDEEEELCA